MKFEEIESQKWREYFIDRCKKYPGKTANFQVSNLASKLTFIDKILSSLSTLEPSLGSCRLDQCWQDLLTAQSIRDVC